tara:strand:- start:64 stop:333 length:270 start_codon:yes stop_codon:yes gene_type:complete
MSFNVTNVATCSSINGGLIDPPFDKSSGKIVCNKVITPVTKRVIDNKGNKSKIQLKLEDFIWSLYVFSRLALDLKCLFMLKPACLFFRI